MWVFNSPTSCLNDVYSQINLSWLLHIDLAHRSTAATPLSASGWWGCAPGGSFLKEVYMACGLPWWVMYCTLLMAPYLSWWMLGSTPNRLSGSCIPVGVSFFISSQNLVINSSLCEEKDVPTSTKVLLLGELYPCDKRGFEVYRKIVQLYPFDWDVSEDFLCSCSGVIMNCRFQAIAAKRAPARPK